MPKTLNQADLDLLKSRGKVLNGFNTIRDDDFKPTDRFPKFNFEAISVKAKSLNNQIIDKVHEIFDNASKIFNRDFDFPTILFKKRGKVAGIANHVTNTLNFNMVLLTENTDHFLKTTVPHEWSHLIARELCLHRIQPHGREWKAVMIKLGASPNRCHSYNTANSTVYEKTKYVYICSCQKHAVGPVRHKKLQKGVRYTCNRCKGNLNFVKNAGKVSRKEALK